MEPVLISQSPASLKVALKGGWPVSRLWNNRVALFAEQSGDKGEKIISSQIEV